MLVLLFFLATTHTEVAGVSGGSGATFVIRALGAFVVLVALSRRQSFSASTFQVSLLVSILFLAPNMVEMSFFAIIGVSMILGGLLIGGKCRDEQVRIDLLYVVRAVILINLAGLLFGLASFFAGWGLVDLHGIVFPWSEARQGLHLGATRLSGFQIEPGTYANLMYVLVLISALLRRRIFGVVETVGLLSTMLSLSAWAVFGVLAYLVACAIEATIDIFRRHLVSSLNQALWLTLLVSFGAFIAVRTIGTEGADYLVLRLSEGGSVGSGQFKQEALNAWIDAIGLEMALGNPLTTTFCSYCLSPQDLGTGFNLIYYFGIVSSLALLGGFLFRLGSSFGFAYIVLLMPLAISKAYFFDFYVWVIVGLVLFSSRQAAENTKRRASSIMLLTLRPR